MSVVVRMDMPKACSWIENGEKKRCPIAEWGGACAITKQFKMPDGCRPSWCPIICSLPEGHGRLGDLDKLEGVVNMARIRVMRNGEDTNPYWKCADLILQAPTIVPADEYPAYMTQWLGKAISPERSET